MPYINTIAKNKGVGYLSDFETMIYIIYNGVHEQMRKRKVVEMMEKILDRVNQNQILSDMEYDRRVYLATEQEEKDEYYELGEKNGEKRGEKRGIKIGEINQVILFCQIKYPYQDLAWIKKCNTKQINEIRKSIIKDHIDYETFYKRIQAIE